MGLGEFGAHNCPIVCGGLGGAKKENRAGLGCSWEMRNKAGRGRREVEWRGLE